MRKIALMLAVLVGLAGCGGAQYYTDFRPDRGGVKDNIMLSDCGVLVQRKRQNWHSDYHNTDTTIVVCRSTTTTAHP